LVVAILAVVISWSLHPEPEKELRKYQWSSDDDIIVLSPDGKKIAYSKGEKLWIRRLDKMDPIEIKSDGFISNIIWSPNSDNIAYFTGLGTNNHELKKVSANGVGNVLIVKTESNYFPRFWGIDDSILVTTWDNKGVNTLLKVPSSGGELKPICGGYSTLSTIKGNLSHVLSLPDDKTLLLSTNFADGRGEILIQTPEKRTTIFSGPPESFIGRPVYSISGHILFPLTNRGSSVPDIWAIPFDPSSLKITGNQFLVARNADQFSVSENGMLLYVDRAIERSGEQLVLLSRSGIILKKISQPQLEIHSPAVSPDGNLVATMSIEEGGTYDIWIHDITKGTKSQLSFDVPETWRPSWSPDGKEIVFQSGFFDSVDIYIQAINSRTSAKQLIHTKQNEGQPFWSHDGRFILFAKSASQPNTQNDIWYLEMGGGNYPKQLFESRFNEDFPYMSPDDRFVAFQSDKSGQLEVYVTDFPKANFQWQVSFEGGVFPQWNGNEIFFVNPRKNELMSAKVKINNGFQSENPIALFSADTAGVQLQWSPTLKYTVTRDGENIVAVKSLMGSVQSKMVLVENWIEEFKNKNEAK
jgi:Tol biopolymer transport system component